MTGPFCFKIARRVELLVGDLVLMYPKTSQRRRSLLASSPLGVDGHLVILVSCASQAFTLARACHTQCECPQTIDSPKFDGQSLQPTRAIENHSPIFWILQRPITIQVKTSLAHQGSHPLAVAGAPLFERYTSRELARIPAWRPRQDFTGRT